MRLIASLVPTSSPQQLSTFAGTHYVRASGGASSGRLCFGASHDQPNDPIQEPSEVAAQLWGQDRASQGAVEHIFSQPPAKHANATTSCAHTVSPAASAAGCAPCCICLEDMQAAKATILCCPSCTMRAHAKCLERWFADTRDGLPKTNGACPSCRALLNWDSLVESARCVALRARPHMPAVKGEGHAQGPEALVGNFSETKGLKPSSRSISPRTARLARTLLSSAVFRSAAARSPRAPPQSLPRHSYSGTRRPTVEVRNIAT